MEGTSGAGKYDLEERTFVLAQRVRAFVRKLPRTVCNFEDVKQLVRSSGSVASNYIEANEALGKKDFLLHIKISRKESKAATFCASWMADTTRPRRSSESHWFRRRPN